MSRNHDKTSRNHSFFARSLWERGGGNVVLELLLSVETIRSTLNRPNTPAAEDVMLYGTKARDSILFA